MTLGSVRGLVALVTGGGSGLGLNVSKWLVQRGARVVSIDLKPPSEPIQDVTALKGDIRKTEDIEKAIDECSKLGKLDAVVNCAAVHCAFHIYQPNTGLPMKLNDFKTVFDINVIGLFDVNRLATRLIAKNQPNDSGCRGVIINTSSILATDGHEGQSAIGAAFMAINSMTLPMARDLSSLGIRCNTIDVGFFDTPLISKNESVELKEFIVDSVPCPRRLGKAEEFSRLVQDLIENQMINGEIIRLDGACRWPARDY